MTRVITKYSLTHFPPLFQDGENYAGKLYTDVTLPVRESSMVVFSIVCVQMLPMRKIILSDNQVIFFFLTSPLGLCG